LAEIVRTASAAALIRFWKMLFERSLHRAASLIVAVYVLVLFYHRVALLASKNGVRDHASGQ
jgi:hypothetical protein